MCVESCWFVSVQDYAIEHASSDVYQYSGVQHWSSSVIILLDVWL